MLSTFFSLAWYNWFARNCALFRNEHLDIVSCHHSAQKILLDYEEANFRLNSQPADISNEGQPAEIQQCYKIIASDAADRGDRGSGLGVIIWDSQGQVIVAKVQRLEMVTSPEIAEALVCRMGAQLAHSLNLYQVNIGSDCLALIQKLKSTTRE